MRLIQAAIYARVSSEQQATAQTIASQVTALRAQAATDGALLLAEDEFLDEGYSGATLIRPALERLRDRAATGTLDRLYVHSPDRLARKYAYQALLVDELQRAGLEIVFLNRPLGQSPEDDLLLQVQGMVAEYERAKILERVRRGKRHAAQAGSVNVLSGAPYGYRYITKHEGGGHAQYEIVLEEARVVRQIFAWVGRDRESIGAVCRRLQAAGERTRTGRTTWDRSVVWAILKNPAYKGEAAYGKTWEGPPRPRLREQRHRPLQPRRPHSTQDRPAEEWLSIPVPALVSAELFASVQEQLVENRQRARQGQRGARYLLQGLVCCARCQYAYYGKALSPSARKGHPRTYAYYRCIGTDAFRFGGQRICDNLQVRTDRLDAAVWEQVRSLLSQPDRLRAEYDRRLSVAQSGAETQERGVLETHARKLRTAVGRLIDAYTEGLIEKTEFEPRISRLKERLAQAEEQVRRVAEEAAQQQELTLLISQLETFAAMVQQRLDEVDWQTQRTLIRTLVKRVAIDREEVNIVFRINPATLPAPPTDGSLHYCGRRDLAPVGQHCLTWPRSSGRTGPSVQGKQR
jgi:site-specific DNA recombinase